MGDYGCNGDYAGVVISLISSLSQICLIRTDMEPFVGQLIEEANEKESFSRRSSDTGEAGALSPVQDRGSDVEKTQTLD